MVCLAMTVAAFFTAMIFGVTKDQGLRKMTPFECTVAFTLILIAVYLGMVVDHLKKIIDHLPH